MVVIFADTEHAKLAVFLLWGQMCKTKCISFITYYSALNVWPGTTRSSSTGKAKAYGGNKKYMYNVIKHVFLSFAVCIKRFCGSSYTPRHAPPHHTAPHRTTFSRHPVGSTIYSYRFPMIVCGFSTHFWFRPEVFWRFFTYFLFSSPNFLTISTAAQSNSL